MSNLGVIQSENIKNDVSEVIVSVIIATYRREVELKRALESLIQQTYKDLEIIVVDDNAEASWNKKVKDIIEEICIQYPIVYIQNEENKGSAETRNIGIRNATGSYITFLDDDDVYLPDKVKNQIEHMVEKSADYCITDLDLYDEKDKLLEKRVRNYIEDFSPNSLLKYHLKYHMTGTDTIMFRKSYLLDIGMFPPIDIGDEFYLMQKAIDGNGRFSYLPGCHVKAYVHVETKGLSSGDGKIKGENELYQYKKKYFNKLNKREQRYIIMRHYAVLAFAELRVNNKKKFLQNAILSFFSSPTQCFKLFLEIVKR